MLFLWGGGGGGVETGACSQFKAETEMTGEDTAGNHRLLLKM